MSTSAFKSLILLLVCGLSSSTRDYGEEATPNIARNVTNLHLTKLPEFQVTRTALHVARSLNPDSTETVHVRTRTGDIATLIVKKRGGKSNLAVPPSVSVSSSTVNVDDVPSAVLVNSSPHEKSKRTLQNAINVVEPPKNSFLSSVFGQQSNSIKPVRVPSPVNIRSSPMSVKGEQQQSKKFWNRGRSTMHIDSDGIPLIHGVRMPDDESDRQTWRNARVINGVLVPYDTSTPHIESNDKQDINRKVPEGPETNNKHTGNSNPFNPYQHTEHVPNSDTHARIMEYINTINQRETKRRSRSQSRADLIQFPTLRKSDETEGRELRDSESRYPLLYTPSRVSFEGVRTPVLQYAHPELGVQSARVMSKQDEEQKVKSQQEYHNNGGNKGNSMSIAYFAQDIHSDHSPYAYEPGTEVNVEQSEVSGTDKRLSNNDISRKNNTYHWPKKSFAYLHQQPSQDTYGLGNDKYIKRFPYNGYNTVSSGSNKEFFNRYKSTTGGSEYLRYPHGEHYISQRYQERPFWERISETIRDHVQTSMEKMSDITRPVVEPLVEASQKISQNLGFASDSNRHTIQNKIGSTVAAYPVLLPALGLVAGGAALGLGAVAVGRYLDVDVMKRRVGETPEDLEVEHKRAFEKIIQDLGKTNLPNEEGTWVIAEEFKNPDEQKKVLDSAARSLRERHQVTSQDDEEKKVLEEIVRALQERNKNQQTHDGIKITENVFTSLKDKPQANIDAEISEKGKNYSPIQDDKVQNTFGRQAVWSRAYDIQNQDKQEETIVRALSAEEIFGRGKRTEQSPNNENQKRSINSSRVKEGNVQNDDESSTDTDIILVVAEEPKSQLSSTINFPKIDKANLYLRREDDLNQGNINVLPARHIRRYFDTFTVEPRRFGDEEANKQEPVLRQNNYHRLLSKRSIEREEEIKSKQYLDNILHNQQEIFVNMALLDAHYTKDWSNTPCAKRIFCDAMVKQSADAVLLMEKKMTTFLSLIQPNEAVTYHLHDVMEAVKQHDCSAFICPRAVDASQVETPNHGPAPR